MNRNEILDKHLGNIHLSDTTRKAVINAMNEAVIFAMVRCNVDDVKRLMNKINNLITENTIALWHDNIGDTSNCVVRDNYIKGDRNNPDCNDGKEEEIEVDDFVTYLEKLYKLLSNEVD